MDYELTLKIRNAPLLNMMRSHGYNTAAELHRASGIAQNCIGGFLNLTYTAYVKDGFTPRKTALRLADFFLVSVQELFPKDHLTSPLARNTFSTQVSSYQMTQLTNSSAEDPMKLLEIFETEGRDSFDDMLKGTTVTDREKSVLTMRLKNDLTLEETAQNLKVTRERIRQIEFKALRKLRHPKNYKKVIEAAGIYGDTIESRWSE